MFGLVIAGSFAVIVAAVGALASLLTAILALRRVEQVHVIVNSANKALRDRVEQLVRSLQEKGIEIPESPDEEEP